MTADSVLDAIGGRCIWGHLWEGEGVNLPPPPALGYLAPAGTLVVEGVEALTKGLVLR